jgi:PII-like signaling protein
MVRQRMICLTIRIKKNDEMQGKRLEKELLEFLRKSKVSGATVWLGVDGFGKSGKSTVRLEGLTINQPMMIDVVEEGSIIEPLLPQLKRMMDDHGIITLHEVDAI